MSGRWRTMGSGREVRIVKERNKGDRRGRTNRKNDDKKNKSENRNLSRGRVVRVEERRRENEEPRMKIDQETHPKVSCTLVL